MPGFGDALMDSMRFSLHIEGHVRHVEEVVSEVFFDQIALCIRNR